MKESFILYLLLTAVLAMYKVIELNIYVLWLYMLVGGVIVLTRKDNEV